jgi:Cu+-exporting ATPase
MNHDHPDAIDPVCGMPVAHDAPLRIEFHGVTYSFCDPACAATFKDDPARWAAEGEGRGFVHDHSLHEA